MELLGTHGTSRTRAEAIAASKKFSPTGSDGHAGAGIYFWAYETSIDLAKHLAYLWWATYSRQGKYSSDLNEELAILNVSIEKPEDKSYCDATTLAFKEALAKMANSFENKSEFEVGPAIAYLVDKIEEKNSSRILVLKASVQSPSRSKKPSIWVKSFPMSDAYIVRSGGDSLIKKIQIID